MILNPPKALNMSQLQAELVSARVPVNGLGGVQLPDGRTSEIHTYDGQGVAVDLPAGAATVIAAHVAMRPLSDQELLIQYADAAVRGDVPGKVNIAGMLNNSRARTQVAM